MQEEVDLKLGQLVAMSVVQGGSGLHVLNFSVYDYLFGMELPNIIAQVSDIPDPDVREVLKKYITCQLCHYLQLTNAADNEP